MKPPEVSAFVSSCRFAMALMAQHEHVRVSGGWVSMPFITRVVLDKAKRFVVVEREHFAHYIPILIFYPNHRYEVKCGPQPYCYLWPGWYIRWCKVARFSETSVEGGLRCRRKKKRLAHARDACRAFLGERPLSTSGERCDGKRKIMATAANTRGYRRDQQKK